jgi:hypothetical protein
MNNNKFQDLKYYKALKRHMKNSKFRYTMFVLKIINKSSITLEAYMGW